MESITHRDLLLINELSQRRYPSNSIYNHTTEEEQEHYKSIKRKLKDLALYFSKRYESIYGPFKTGVSTGNQISYSGHTLRRVWSGLFKGAQNKQYAAQISFVMNPDEPCLDVGFYFGRSSSHSLSKEEKIALEDGLISLGNSIADAIDKNEEYQDKYNALFDFGFSASSNGFLATPDEWRNIIRTDTKNSQIIAKIGANDLGVIDNSTIDAYIAQVIFLMTAIDNKQPSRKIIIPPKTPKQRAKQAERLAEIGFNGEIFIFNLEKDKIIATHGADTEFPKHVALESDHYGYDIITLDDKGQEQFIEVKTTTRKKNDSKSRYFFLSINEYETYKLNKEKYKLYRVYDIENNPHFDEIDLTQIELAPDGYIVSF